MFISGTGISSEIRVKILPDFKVDTTLSLKWVQTEDNQWHAIDRGYLADTYESEFTVAGKQSTVETFIDAIDDNRAANSNQLTLRGFEDTEHIFGEDVDHQPATSITATILSIGDMVQRSWQVWAVTVRARAVSPAFVGTATLPDLQNTQIGLAKALEWSINKQDTYYGTYYYADKEYPTDRGRLNLTTQLSVANHKNMRRYLATQRGSTISIPDISMDAQGFGITNPWGITRPLTFPITAKVIEWEDVGWWGITHRIMNLKLAEVV